MLSKGKVKAMDKEDNMLYGNNDNDTKNPTPDGLIPCPVCQGAGEVVSLKQIYINNTARFNCTCGRWLTLTPFKDTVTCIKCGEVWRWVVFSDSQLEQTQQVNLKGGGMSPEQAEEVRNKLNMMIQGLNMMSVDISGIIANTKE